MIMKTTFLGGLLNHDNEYHIINYAPQSLKINVGGILSGGGDLTTDRTITFNENSINKLYNIDGSTPIVYIDEIGSLNINGNIIQNGETYETHAEEIYTTKDLIITRENSISSIPIGQLSGIQVNKYNATDNLFFGSDSQGYFKVGEESSLQILATREDSPNNTSIAFWNDTEKRFDTDSNLTWNGSTLSIVGELTTTGDITAYLSDERLKKFTGVIDNAIEKINLINGYYFEFNSLAESFGYKDKSKQVGVNAQELQKVLPEVVKLAPFDKDDNNQSKSGENYLTVSYEKIIPLLIQAIKEQNQKILYLENLIHPLLKE